jgi:heme/copper-type cytochrome/quinol oxidase subunit 2
MEDTMGWMWNLMTVVGPILLIVTVIWATVYTRRGWRARREREKHRRQEAQSTSHTFEGE